MKCKKFYSIFAAIAIACSQAVVPAFATETTPNGDWIDTSSMTPVYENDSVTTTNYGAVLAEDCAGDSIIEFSVEMKGNYQIHSYYPAGIYSEIQSRNDFCGKLQAHHWNN